MGKMRSNIMFSSTDNKDGVSPTDFAFDQATPWEKPTEYP